MSAKTQHHEACNFKALWDFLLITLMPLGLFFFFWHPMRQCETAKLHLLSHLSPSHPWKRNWTHKTERGERDEHPGGETFTWHPPPPPVLTGRWCISPLCLHLPPRLRLAYRAAFSVCEKRLFLMSSVDQQLLLQMVKQNPMNSNTSYSIKTL